MNSLIETLNRSGDLFVSLAGPMLLQSSIVIVVLFGFDWLLRDRVRAVIRHAVWMLALLKLILPPSLALPTSPAYWLRQIAPPAQRPMAMAVSPPLRGETAPAVLPVTVATESLPSPPRRTPLSTAGFVFSGWLAVVAGLIGCLLQRARTVRRVVTQAMPAPDALNSLVTACAAQLSLRHRLAVRVTDAVPGPALCGLFRPVILIPSQLAKSLSVLQLRAVFVHELGHFKRGDLWINHAQTLLQIVYWWHPLLWLANSRIRRVREEAVDEAVLAVMGRESDSYPDALLEIGKLTLAPVRGFIGLVGIVESRSALARRIKRLVRLPFEPKARVGLVGAIATIMTGLILVPMAACQTSRANKREPNHSNTASAMVDKGADTFALNNSRSESVVRNAEPRLHKTTWRVFSGLPNVAAGLSAWLGQTGSVNQTNVIAVLQDYLTASGISFAQRGTSASWGQRLLSLKDQKLIVSLPHDLMDIAAPLISALSNGERPLRRANPSKSPISYDEEKPTSIMQLPYDSDAQLILEELALRVYRLPIPTTYASWAPAGILTAIEDYYIAHPDGGTVNLAWLKVHWAGLMTQIGEASKGEMVPFDKWMIERLGMRVAATTSARERIRWKLVTIELSDVVIERKPLAEVVKDLVTELRQRDPDKGGVNFIINSATNSSDLNKALVTVPRQAKITAAHLLDEIVKGSDEQLQYSYEDYAVVFHSPVQALKKAEAATPENKSSNSRVTAPDVRANTLANDTAADVVQNNASGRTADAEPSAPVTHDQIENGSAAGPGQALLLTRQFQVNWNALSLDFLDWETAPSVSEKGPLARYQEHLRRSALNQRSLPPYDSKALKQSARTVRQQPTELVRRFFDAAGVDLPGSIGAGEANASPTGRKAVFYNDRTGVLFVRATPEDLEVVEKALQVLGGPSQQILLEMQFAEVTDSEFQQLGLDWILGDPLARYQEHLRRSALNQQALRLNDYDSNTSETPPSAQSLTLQSKALTDAQFRALRRALEQKNPMQSPPRLVTIDGRQAEFPLAGTTKNSTIISGTNSSTYSSSIAVTPELRDAERAGQTIDLHSVITLASFLGHGDPGSIARTLLNPTAPPNPVASDERLPRVRVRQALGSVAAQDGQTVLLVTDLFEPASQGKPAANPDAKRFIIFVTPTLIDPAGNRIHPK